LTRCVPLPPRPILSGLSIALIAASLATGYNVISVPLAAGVLAFAGVVLSPAAGAVLMSVATIVVALNAQLLRRVKVNPAQVR
jgi:cation transport ATPase